MKIIAQTAALQEALNLAAGIVAVRTPKPVLQCVKLIAANNTLTILATDLEAACRYTVPQVEVQTEGEALVPVQKFADIVRESSGEEALTIAVDGQACTITGAGSRFKLNSMDPGEFPVVAEFDGQGDFQVAAETLSGLIDRTLFAVARAHSHYAISGVLWETAGKKLQLVSTDGHRLALAKAALSKAAEADVKAIVPGKFMNLLQRAMGTSDETLAVKVTETQILVQAARAVLICSLVQGNFPKYTDVIPKDASRKAVVNTEAFLHRIRQAALLTSDESKSVRLAFGAEELTLTGRSPEAGEAEVTMPVKLTGEPIEIAFNPTFLAEALKVATADEVVLELDAGNKPALMRAGDSPGGDFLYVVMPVDLG